MISFLNKVARYVAAKTEDARQPKKLPYYITGACKILEIDYGHYRSFREKKSINEQNQALPWFTYPALDYLDQLDLQSLTMLEWGSGNSSLFFAGRVSKLCSIEHDWEWFNQIKALNLSNQELLHVEQERYAEAACGFNTVFDVILIDGIERLACSKIAVSLLSRRGIIILDNSDRHPDIAEEFRKRDFIEVDFHGFGPINSYTWTTSIFFSRGCTIQPTARQPKVPIGGGY